MEPIRTFGLDMDLPEGRRPGIDTQIIAELAESSPPIDRDKELLIFGSRRQQEEARAVMERHGVACENFDLLLFPDGAELRPSFTDYGFTSSQGGRIYAYADAVFLYTLRSRGPQAEPSQALLQMEEHLLASFEQNGEMCCAADIQSDELMERIARAYGCEISPLSAEN
ncbi:hypothetical protein [Paenibacillus doosanensis]|uniref:hypothetical protein n=1 Tax=Paenibacillus doosanensis TaxID=1229154 RepID=UPI0021809B70|nr:hypothetical protein [Paenibacillus doosanensis]